MNRRNLKVRNFLQALRRYGCIEKRSTSHGVIIENSKNNKSTNVPTHHEEIAVWIYGNILRQLGIDKGFFEKEFF